MPKKPKATVPVEVELVQDLEAAVAAFQKVLDTLQSDKEAAKTYPNLYDLFDKLRRMLKNMLTQINFPVDAKSAKPTKAAAPEPDEDEDDDDEEDEDEDEDDEDEEDEEDEGEEDDDEDDDDDEDEDEKPAPKKKPAPKPAPKSVKRKR